DSKGRFTCLGYDDESEPEIEKAPRKERTKAEPVIPIPPLRVGVDFEDAITLQPGSTIRTAYFGTPISAAELNQYLAPPVDSFMVPTSPEGPLLIFSPPTHDQGQVREQATPGHKSNNIIARPLSFPIPRGISVDAIMRESYVMFIVEEYLCHRVNLFFRPPPISMRGLLMAQMKRSRIMEFMFLGAKIFQAFSGKSEDVAMRLCSHWVTWYASHVISPDNPPNCYPSTQEVEDRLNELLELFTAQLIVQGTTAGYTTLRLALSSFLHLVSDDPDLWIEQGRSGMLCISLPAVLTSNRIETRRFVYHDVVYSLILGLPTIAEYDSAGFPIAPGATIPIQWIRGIHGIPVEMFVNIVEVSNWRAGRKDVDWAALEMRALAWKWRQVEIESKESAEMIYRVAIQEAWRHATLIYIYMGMCEATSGDPRVQASVHQIVKLMGVIGDTHLDVHFSVPALVAGIAARSERQRATILRTIKTFNGVRLWILRGRDFARVLKHLWNGPAARGTAIRWDEYVEARCKVLPM
ncbi:unnamed protein product, partial [Rhizoctonia solani]